VNNCWFRKRICTRAEIGGQAARVGRRNNEFRCRMAFRPDGDGMDQVSSTTPGFTGTVNLQLPD